MGACSSPHGGTADEVDTAGVVSQDAGAMLVGDHLVKVVKVVDQRTTRDANGILIGKSVLENISNKPAVLQVRTIFKSKEGFTTEISEWQRVDIPSNRRVRYTAPSVKADSERFLLQIRDNVNE